MLCFMSIWTHDFCPRVSFAVLLTSSEQRSLVLLKIYVQKKHNCVLMMWAGANRYVPVQLMKQIWQDTVFLVKTQGDFMFGYYDRWGESCSARSPSRFQLQEKPWKLLVGRRRLRNEIHNQRLTVLAFMNADTTMKSSQINPVLNGNFCIHQKRGR